MATLALQKNRITTHGSPEKSIFIALIYITGALLVAYLFFIGHITFTVLARKSLENSQRMLSSEIGEMELTYLALNGEVDLNLAYELGFKDAGADAFFADMSGKTSTVGFIHHE
jgi:hypothetical protein